MRFACASFAGIIAVATFGCGSSVNKEASDESVELWRLKQEDAFVKKLREVSDRFAAENPGWKEFEQGKWQKKQEAVSAEVREKEAAFKAKHKANSTEVGDFSKGRDAKRQGYEKDDTLKGMVEMLETRVKVFKNNLDADAANKQKVYKQLDTELDETFSNARQMLRNFEDAIKTVPQ